MRRYQMSPGDAEDNISSEAERRAQKEKKSNSQGEKPRPILCRRERPVVPTLAGAPTSGHSGGAAGWGREGKAAGCN